MCYSFLLQRKLCNIKVAEADSEINHRTSTANLMTLRHINKPKGTPYIHWIRKVFDPERPNKIKRGTLNMTDLSVMHACTYTHKHAYSHHPEYPRISV